VIERLAKAMARVMATPKARDLLATLGAEATVLGPDEFAAYVAADEKRLLPIIHSLHLKTN
jgi:tripartite-type tricarboxylate transporter receptor subunit TctC